MLSSQQTDEIKHVAHPVGRSGFRNSAKTPHERKSQNLLLMIVTAGSFYSSQFLDQDRENCSIRYWVNP
jgi:hypothetical protein